MLYRNSQSSIQCGIISFEIYRIIVENAKILMYTSYITLMETRRISLKNKYNAFLIIHTFYIADISLCLQQGKQNVNSRFI